MSELLAENHKLGLELTSLRQSHVCLSNNFESTKFTLKAVDSEQKNLEAMFAAKNEEAVNYKKRNAQLNSEVVEYLDKIQLLDKTNYELRQTLDETEKRQKEEIQRNILFLSTAKRSEDQLCMANHKFEEFREKCSRLMEDNKRLFSRLKSQEEMLSDLNNIIEDLKLTVRKKDIELTNLEDLKMKLLKDNTNIHSDYNRCKLQMARLKENNIKLCCELEKVVQDDQLLLSHMNVANN